MQLNTVTYLMLWSKQSCLRLFIFVRVGKTFIHSIFCRYIYVFFCFDVRSKNFHTKLATDENAYFRCAQYEFKMYANALNWLCLCGYYCIKASTFPHGIFAIRSIMKNASICVDHGKCRSWKKQKLQCHALREMTLLAQVFCRNTDTKLPKIGRGAWWELGVCVHCSANVVHAVCPCSSAHAHTYSSNNRKAAGK